MRKYILNPLVVKRTALAIVILEVVLGLVFILCLGQDLDKYGVMDFLLNLWFWLFAVNALLTTLLIIKKPSNYVRNILALVLVPPIRVITLLFLFVATSGVTC